jgi:hypothetical protein
MDVLAGRKTGGTISGEVRVNGFPKNQRTFARVAGYVEQEDGEMLLLLAELTYRCGTAPLALLAASSSYHLSCLVLFA